ncbi:MAG: GNAT family N-acetyltransferase [Saccharofermentanales bacterium]
MRHKCLIRQAEIADLEEMKQVIKVAMDQYSLVSHIPVQSPVDALRETSDDLKSHILSDYFLVAVFEGKIVGTIRVSEISEEAAYISRFTVLPSIQKIGVGSVIFEAAENYIIKKGYREVSLHTALRNTSLVRFYEKHQFRLWETKNDRGYARGTFIKHYA